MSDRARHAGGIPDDLLSDRLSLGDRKIGTGSKPVEPALRFIVSAVRAAADKRGISPKELLLNREIYVTVVEVYLKEVRGLHEKVIGALLGENNLATQETSQVETLAHTG